MRDGCCMCGGCRVRPQFLPDTNDKSAASRHAFLLLSKAARNDCPGAPGVLPGLRSHPDCLRRLSHQPALLMGGPCADLEAQSWYGGFLTNEMCVFFSREHPAKDSPRASGPAVHRQPLAVGGQQHSRINEWHAFPYKMSVTACHR